MAHPWQDTTLPVHVRTADLLPYLAPPLGLRGDPQQRRPNRPLPVRHGLLYTTFAWDTPRC
ncbi:hypothetical protein ACWCOW_42945, partial [Streptomyces sp. NPDC001939]